MTTTRHRIQDERLAGGLFARVLPGAANPARASWILAALAVVLGVIGCLVA